MITSIIEFSVKNKLIIALLVIGLIGGGIFALRQLPIDAVPDITNNQVQVVTIAPSLAAQEVEQFITYPVEIAVANIPDVLEIRSISRFGLSVVTIVFKEKVPVLHARQYVKEQIDLATDEIPPGLGKPELMPITTGLGEIYQYVLRVQPGYEDRYDAMELRTIQDWIVKRQLAGTPGIVEISSFGGYLKQYEVALDPVLLQSYDVSIAEIFTALNRNNQNTGGSYIEKTPRAYYIRTEGIVKSIADIENIVIANRGGIPVLVKNVAQVQFGAPKRFGAMTMDGKGEVVGGITLMLKGANSSEAIANVRNRIAQVQKSLPEGVELYAYLDRAELVGKTIRTVQNNLLEGGAIVIMVLVLLLGNLRAGLVVASVIPLSMLFGLILMRIFGLSANLMSLGAIDFGIVVDGAVIIVEGVLHTMFALYVGRTLSRQQMDGLVIEASAKLFRAAVFGVFIILIVFIPIMLLTDIEGKMFRPMAMSFSFVMLGALLLSLTYVPMMTALVMPLHVHARRTFADRIIAFLQNLYRPALRFALRLPYLMVGLAVALLLSALLIFRTLGAEFIPTLEEGDLAMQMAIPPGSSLSESIATATKAERILLDSFQEVQHVVSKIGTAEIPTDPMAIEDADIMIILKEKSEWINADNREELADKMKDALDVIVGASFEFTQPIQLRFNELMTGAKTDIAVKIFGEDLEELKRLADRSAGIIERIPGAGDVKVEQTEGLPQWLVQFNRVKIAEYGLNIEDLNTLIRTAYAGETAGVVFENERKFDLVIRLHEKARNELDLNRLFVHLDNGQTIPLSEVATVSYAEGPMQISREKARRRINVGINVRNRDIASLVADVETALNAQLRMPPGYSIEYGGQFENLQQAKGRLYIAVPAALLLIFVLLYFAFGQLRYALLIFTAVPLAAIGGVFALWLRDMPFSISAGIGFIALFGVAVLNGIVMVSAINDLFMVQKADLQEAIQRGAVSRLRPVLITAITDALGFLPMALSTTNGAEVQKPLATVVIGGLITSTLLTLLLLPVLYWLINRRRSQQTLVAGTVGLLLLIGNAPSYAQQPLPLDSAIQHALRQHPALQNSDLQIERAKLGIAGARQIPKTDLNLSIGQVDGTLVDFYFGTTQSLGNLAADKQRREVARAEVSLNESERALLQRQIQRQVQQQWYAWIYQSERQQRLQQQLELYRNTAERAALQMEAGEINRLDKTLIDNQLLAASKAFTTAAVEVQQAYTRLQQAAFLTGAYEPPADAFVAIALPVAPRLHPALMAPWQQRIRVAEAETVLQEKQLAPEWSFGYFVLSLRPLFPLQGVMGGVSLPIFNKPQRARIEQQRLQAIIRRNDLAFADQQWQQQQALAAQQVQLLREQLDTNGAALNAQAQTLRELATLQWRNGEIDYFRYVQSLEVALRNELDYLELVHGYNQAVLELLFLAGE